MKNKHSSTHIETVFLFALHVDNARLQVQKNTGDWNCPFGLYVNIFFEIRFENALSFIVSESFFDLTTKKPRDKKANSRACFWSDLLHVEALSNLSSIAISAFI